jgi:hypothetical protein
MEPGLELFLFQEERIRFASEREGALIADEMGLGKSIQAIGVVMRIPRFGKLSSSVLPACEFHGAGKWSVGSIGLYRRCGQTL